eukprot:3184999-Pyramimonas_sp.AAC.1
MMTEAGRVGGWSDMQRRGWPSQLNFNEVSHLIGHKRRYSIALVPHWIRTPRTSAARTRSVCHVAPQGCHHIQCSLSRLCLEGFLLYKLKGSCNGPRPGRCPRHPPR